MENTEEIAERFRELRKAKGLSQAEVAPLVGCSHKSVGNFERGDVNPGGAVLVRAVKLIEQWERELGQSRVRESRVSYPAPAPGVVRIEQFTDPLQILHGGLVNTAALLRDDSIPLRARLVHTRTQLEFLLNNFLSDASLPAE